LSLRWPPEDPSELREFPVRALLPDRDLFRVVRIGNGPWWFGSSMEGRFDLPEPDGTCYLAADALSALAEIIGPESERGLVSAEFLRGRRLVRLRVPRETVVSDATSRKAIGFGVTAEIGSVVPYDCPQAWASKLRAAGAEGIVYWLRHDPSRVEGFALFGPHGERRDWPWETDDPKGIPPSLIERLREELGIEVHEMPLSAELRIIG
jgi:hypothetical protein